MSKRLLAVREALSVAIREGLMHVDLDAAQWCVERALKGEYSESEAFTGAMNVLRALGKAPGPEFRVDARTITREQHDELLGREMRGVSREDYERMMREAQDT